MRRFALFAALLLVAIPASADDALDAIARWAATQPRPAPAVVAPYPRRSKSGLTYTNTSRQHLASTHGFDPEWLNTLDWRQLQALHADAHTGDVRPQAVRRSRPAGRWVRQYVCGDRGCSYQWRYVTN